MRLTNRGSRTGRSGVVRCRDVRRRPISEPPPRGFGTEGEDLGRVGLAFVGRDAAAVVPGDCDADHRDTVRDSDRRF